MSCYNALMRRYTSLKLDVSWDNKWETSGGSLILQSIFSGSKTWTYQDFRPWQIENRFAPIPTPVPPEIVPCPSGKFTFYQECCDVYAYRKDEYGFCSKNVFALFDGVKDYVAGQPAGIGWLSGTVNVTGLDPHTYEAKIPIQWGLPLGHWDSAGANGINLFTVQLPDEDSVPYAALPYLTYPTSATELIDFTSGSPFSHLEPSIFSFAYITATSGATWTCFDNVKNMMFNRTGNVSGTYTDGTGKKYTPNISVQLTLT